MARVHVYIASLSPAPIRCLARAVYIDLVVLRMELAIGARNASGLSPPAFREPDDLQLMQALVACSAYFSFERPSVVEVELPSHQPLLDWVESQKVINAADDSAQHILQSLHCSVLIHAAEEDARFLIYAAAQLIKSGARNRLLKGELLHHIPLSHSWDEPNWWEFEPPKDPPE